MKKIKDWAYRNKKWIQWFSLLFGAGVFLISLKLFLFSIFLYASVDKSGSLFVGMVAFQVALFCWNLAYQIQDSFWYRRQYEKTGDDFEHRY